MHCSVCSGYVGFELSDTADGAADSSTEAEVAPVLPLNHTGIPVV